MIVVGVNKPTLCGDSVLQQHAVLSAICVDCCFYRRYVDNTS